LNAQRRNLRAVVGFLIGATLSGFAAEAEAPDLRPVDLSCEYLVDPLGVDASPPRLTWTLESDRRGDVQTAYRILVASSPERLARDEGDLWDSGKVASDATALIPFGGKPLASRQACHWKVAAWNRDGQQGPWSAPARWEMGLLSPEDWSAKWIEAAAAPVDVKIARATYYSIDGAVRKDVTAEVAALVARREPVVAKNEALGGDPARDVRKRLEIRYEVGGTALETDVAEGATAVLARERQPYLRKRFSVRNEVQRARLYVTALGFYEAYLNGRRVGDHQLEPGWTDYRKRVRYQTYDVTEQLAQGENVLGAVTAPGWFCGRAGLFNARQFYGKTPALIAQLEITHADGSVERIVSDDSWVRRDGPILAADLMDGEIFDAAGEIAGWCTAALDDGGWSPVTLRDESRNLEASIDAPIRVVAELPARSVSEPAPKRWTFDLGQNMVGVVRLRLQAKAGTVITLRHAEMLNPDGTIYTANLRSASATDTYICKGGGVEEWRPHFTFHGFRYVELTGLDEQPPPDTVTGVVLSSDIEPAGEFACSDERLNQLQSNILWGMRGNYVSIPTDCPQRDERMGWMADTQVFVPTAAYNADVAPFLAKWMRDVEDAQRADGAHADVAPVMNGLSYGTPAWADAGTIVPWDLYRMYGDTRILERHIDSMMRWVDWCREHSTNLIRDRDRGNDYGDWLSIGANTPKDVLGTAYFAYSTDIVARSLAILGRDADAARYRQLFDEIRAAFNGKYVSEDGRITGDTQTCYLMALRFNLLPEELRDAALRHLLADIEAKGWHLSTGFVGVGMLLPVLTEAGRTDVAWRLLMQDTFPSWLFSVRHGATTIWERWDGWTPEGGVHRDFGMNSFNHYALGSCGQWLYEGVGGIRPDPDRPGFGHFYVEPRVDGALTWAKTKYRSIRGEIATHWRLEGDALALDVQIPANTTATVRVPRVAGTEVRESGRPIASAEGVKLIQEEDDAVILRVGSGRYAFTARGAWTRIGNPVFPGWYADPEVARFGDRIWIYPTYSAPYDQQLFLDAFSTPDLATWTKHPRILDASAISWARRAIWAPSVIEKDGRFFLFFGANDIQSDEQVGGIGVAVSDSPAGPFRDHLGKPLIDRFHNGAQPIDQFVFRDEDGRHYLYYGGWRHCNVARLRDDFKGFEPFDDGTTFREITPENYVEGPFLFRRGGKYYFMWSEGGWTGPDYSVAYAIGESPLGPFRRIGKILQQDPAVATGAGHHSVLHLPERDECYIVYHRRPLGETDGNHRVVCIDRMTFDDQGRIQPVKITFGGVKLIP